MASTIADALGPCQPARRPDAGWSNDSPPLPSVADHKPSTGRGFLGRNPVNCPKGYSQIASA
jgi:hypothetical protein